MSEIHCNERSENRKILNKIKLSLKQPGTNTHTHTHSVNPSSHDGSNLMIHFQSGPRIIWPNSAGVDSIWGQRVKWSRDFSQEESIQAPQSWPSLGLNCWTLSAPLAQSYCELGTRSETHGLTLLT